MGFVLNVFSRLKVFANKYFYNKMLFRLVCRYFYNFVELFYRNNMKKIISSNSL